MPDAPGQDDRLDSWKEIAAYLKRDATTVQRWERREGMPVHRHLHGTLGSVYAFRGELDAWQRARKPAEPAPAAAAIAPGAAPARPARATRRRIGWAVAAAATVVVAVGAVMLARRADYFWVSPLAGAQLRRLTDFEGTERAAAISH
ncbi:MAG: tolB protein, partial [Acidobacteria bacterium]|nr:tolB protein [Acidobacteriota bacterium]